MRSVARSIAVFLLVMFAAAAEETTRVGSDAWPQWRGPLATGVAPEATPPVNWAEDQNIRWKVPIPGHGHSSPIVWGNRIFLATAVSTGNVIPCPVAGGRIVFCMSGFRGNALKAIRLDEASGDLTGRPEALAWSRRANTPYVPSPLLYDGLLYFLEANKGILTCVDAATGEEQYGGSRQLEDIGTIYASPVGAAGFVYLTGKDGLTCVIRQGPAFEVLARNKLDDEFSASAAIVGDELFLRGRKNLYCIADRSTDARP